MLQHLDKATLSSLLVKSNCHKLTVYNTAAWGKFRQSSLMLLYKKKIWSFLNIELVSPLYLSSHTTPLSGHILHIFGGCEANEALISTKPATSSTILLTDLLRKVAISKVASEEHARAAHALVRLSDSAFLISGGTQKNSVIHKVYAFSWLTRSCW